MAESPYLTRASAIDHLHGTAAAFCLGTASLDMVLEAVHLALRSHASRLDINLELRARGLSWDEERDLVRMRS
jgi:Arc/MetJ family transcription regulator